MDRNGSSEERDMQVVTQDGCVRDGTGNGMNVGGLKWIAGTAGVVGTGYGVAMAKADPEVTLRFKDGDVRSDGSSAKGIDQTSLGMIGIVASPLAVAGAVVAATAVAGARAPLGKVMGGALLGTVGGIAAGSLITPPVVRDLTNVDRDPSKSFEQLAKDAGVPGY